MAFGGLVGEVRRIVLHWVLPLRSARTCLSLGGLAAKAPRVVRAEPGEQLWVLSFDGNTRFAGTTERAVSNHARSFIEPRVGVIVWCPV